MKGISGFINADVFFSSRLLNKSKNGLWSSWSTFYILSNLHLTVIKVQRFVFSLAFEGKSPPSPVARVTMAPAFRLTTRLAASENMSQYTVDFSAERAGLQRLHFLPG